MRVLLVSTYELGHQPLHVASPAAALRRAGQDVRALDLGVDPWAPAEAMWADAVVFSVPMHTAMRLAVRAARGNVTTPGLTRNGGRATPEHAGCNFRCTYCMPKEIRTSAGQS